MNKFIKRSAIMIAIILMAVFTTNCKKDSSNKPVAGTYNLSFNINNVEPSLLKSTNSDTIICTNLLADYVMYKVDNGPLTKIGVFYVNNIPFTNSVKLIEGPHILQEFLVYSDNNTPNDATDDILLMATPHSSSVFAGYVTTPLDKSFTVNVDNKLPLKLDVICFQPQYFTKFGFVYYQLNELTIRQLWFFGDFCIKGKEDYNGSQYTSQTNWGTGIGFIDAPAIAKVEVWRNGTLQNTFQNSAQGEKFSVTYGDYKQTTDAFEIKLFILVRQGTTFGYKFFKSWTFNDISNIPQGTDGVVDFVLGNCYDPITPPDLILAPYMNLPATATYKITGWNPSTIINGYQGYVDATLSNIPSGYELSNGLYASNCADHSTTIYLNTGYNMDVYSSLYPSQLPLFAQSTKWEKINWLYNHLDYFPGYLWSDIQGAIWLYDNPVWNGQATTGMPALSPMMTTMKNQMDLYGAGYKVPPGGWATIIFIPQGTLSNSPTPTIQTMFTRTDP